MFLRLQRLLAHTVITPQTPVFDGGVVTGRCIYLLIRSFVEVPITIR